MHMPVFLLFPLPQSLHLRQLGICPPWQLTTMKILSSFLLWREYYFFWHNLWSFYFPGNLPENCVLPLTGIFFPCSRCKLPGKAKRGRWNLNPPIHSLATIYSAAVIFAHYMVLKVTPILHTLFTIQCIRQLVRPVCTLYSLHTVEWTVFTDFKG